MISRFRGELEDGVIIRGKGLVIAKHLAGKHDQKTHGRGGGTIGGPAKNTDYGSENYKKFQKYIESEESYLENERFQDAAQRWSGNEYKSTQRLLLSDNPSSSDEMSASIVSEFDEAMTPLDNLSGYLYRGQTEGLENLQVGDSFKSPRFQSTTTDPITAATFAKSSGGVIGWIKEGETATIMRIEPFDAKGVVIPDSSEYEIVLARNTTFDVYKISEETINGVKLRIIDVEAVSDDE